MARICIVYSTTDGHTLAICRRIVVAHRGRIYARNRPEGGAEMRVELPLNLHETADS